MAENVDSIRKNWTVRLRDDELASMTRAADLVGRSTTDLVRTAALLAAQDIINADERDRAERAEASAA